MFMTLLGRMDKPPMPLPFTRSAERNVCKMHENESQGKGLTTEAYPSRRRFETRSATPVVVRAIRRMQDIRKDRPYTRPMCLILFAYRADADWPLVLLANRDEVFARRTATAAYWDEAPHVFGGRDLEKRGTWLGVTRNARLACVTNVRAPWARREGRSRGALVADFLLAPPSAAPSAESYAKAVDGALFPAFNALFFDGNVLVSCDESGVATHVAPGVHGLSNARLDTSWPKVDRGVSELRAWLDGKRHEDDAFGILARREPGQDDALPKTGVPLDVERALSSAFVHGLAHVGYGTRTSTLVRVGRDSVEVVERTFGASGTLSGEVRARIPCV
jgi:uncharacterized protein with NRDE domain